MAKRWNVALGKEVENLKIDVFLADVLEVERKHGLALSHEDCHGAFIIVGFSDDLADWLKGAHDGTAPPLL